MTEKFNPLVLKDKDMQQIANNLQSRGTINTSSPLFIGQLQITSSNIVQF